MGRGQKVWKIRVEHLNAITLSSRDKTGASDVAKHDGDTKKSKPTTPSCFMTIACSYLQDLYKKVNRKMPNWRYEIKKYCIQLR